jgi:hypothetical protein
VLVSVAGRRRSNGASFGSRNGFSGRSLRWSKLALADKEALLDVSLARSQACGVGGRRSSVRVFEAGVGADRGSRWGVLLVLSGSLVFVGPLNASLVGVVGVGIVGF